MKRIFFLLSIVLLCQAARAAQACEDTPIIVASAYISSNSAVFPAGTSEDPVPTMEFVHVPGECYCMGADMGADGTGPSDAGPVHQVCVDDYYMGKYEVTQAQWRMIMGTNPSTLSSCGDNCPVVDMSWREAQEFIRRLSQRTGKTYRLPTKAEWELASRSSGVPDTVSAANTRLSDRKQELHPVG